MQKKFVATAALFAFILLILPIQAQEGMEDKKKVYVCPPCGVDCHDDKYSEPGVCRVCRMELVVQKKAPKIRVGKKSETVNSNDVRLIASYDAQETSLTFQYDPEKITIGTVYQYQKSNIDDSHSGNIALYVASNNRLEALKWRPIQNNPSHEGHYSATLVTAEMDWKTFSVRRFETSKVDATGRKLLVAVLQAVPERPQVIIRFGENEPYTVTIDRYPWHSYDFDFASLNFTFRHLINPEKPFVIGISDFAFVDGSFRFGNKGTVEIIFVREENRQNILCRKYLIDGPGLENRGGTIWVSKEDGYLVEYQIDLPDERSFKSGKLVLRKIETVDLESWQYFVKNRRWPE